MTSPITSEGMSKIVHSEELLSSASLETTSFPLLPEVGTRGVLELRRYGMAARK